MHEFLPRLTLNRFRSASIAIQSALLAAFLITVAAPAQAQAPTPRSIVIPSTSHANAADLGVNAHTNVRYADTAVAYPSAAPNYAEAEETPQSIACLYGVVQPSYGCNPATATNTPTGGSQTIAIVDAFDDPNAASDLANFSAQWGVPYNPSKFKVIYAGGSEPAADPTGGWEIEEATDIEYSHSMAPNAMIYLVEANSDSYADLFTAVQVANNLVLCGKTSTCPRNSKGKGEVSMSWGGSEWAQESADDSYFTTPGVVYFAAAGDYPGPEYPCVSPNVVCAGGTSDSRNEVTGNLNAQVTWQDAGGGISSYETTPSYQASLRYQLGGQRGVPDLSADSNPYTGVWVLDTYPIPGAGWYTVGGTSVATPVLAGVVNAAGYFASSTNAELTALYGKFYSGAFTSITYGMCGYYSGTLASYGWDQCTGLGTPANLGSNDGFGGEGHF
jgi:kumamolisin